MTREKRLQTECVWTDDIERRGLMRKGIRSRQLVRPIEWYMEPRGWPERTEATSLE